MAVRKKTPKNRMAQVCTEREKRGTKAKLNENKPNKMGDEGRHKKRRRREPRDKSIGEIER